MNITDLFTPSIEIAHDAATLAVNILVQSSLIVATGLLAARLLRGHGAAVQSTVLRVTLVAVLACPFASWMLAEVGVSGFGVELPQAEMAAVEREHEVALAAESSEPSGQPAFEVAEVVRLQESEIAPLNSHRLSNAESSDSWHMEVEAASDLQPTAQSDSAHQRQEPMSQTASVPLIAWVYRFLGSAWLLVTLLLVARIVLANAFVLRGRVRATNADPKTVSICQQLARTIRIRAPAVRISSEIKSPCLVGVFRSAILLPAGMRSISRDVLVHELAHLRRRDCVWQLLSCLTTAVVWFQPLVWLLSRRLEQTADDVADDFVVKFGSDRAEYARQLVDIAEHYQPEWSAACVGAGIVSFKSSLGKRIVRILDTSRSLSTRTGFAALAAILLLGATCTLAVGLLGAGSAQAGHAATDSADQIQQSEQQEDAGVPAADAESEVTCKGRVLDPDGKPLANAKLYLASNSDEFIKGIVRTTSGNDGRFEFTVKRELLGELPTDAQVVAIAPGFGLNWQKLLDDKQQLRALEIKLVEDVPIEGRIINIEGQPVADATIDVVSIRTSPDDNLDGLIDAWKRDEEPRLRFAARDRLVTKRLRFPESLGIQFAKTDADGRFRMAGYGRDRWLNATVKGPQIGGGTIIVLTRPKQEVEPLVKQGAFSPTYGSSFEHAAPPGRPIIGTVRDRKTGEPLAGAYVYCSGARAQTDEDGNYRLENVAKAEQYWVAARTDEHFQSSSNTRDQSGLDPLKVDLELDPGIPIQVRVRDKATGRRLHAQFAYYGAVGNKNVEGTQFAANPYFGTIGGTEGKRSGRMVVFPGPGFLCVRANENRYMPDYPRGFVSGGARRMMRAIPNPFEVDLFHKVIEINPQAGNATSLEIDVELDSSGTLSGRVTGPDDKPLDDVIFAGQMPIRPWSGNGFVMLDSPEFMANGLHPKEPRTLLFLQREQELAKALDVTANTKGPLAVSLDEMGSLTGQVVDADGNARTNVTVLLQVRSHETTFGRGMAEPRSNSLEQSLFGDSELQAKILRATAKVDDAGRFRFDWLIAGLTYEVYARTDSEIGKLAGNVKPMPGKEKKLGAVQLKPLERPKRQRRAVLPKPASGLLKVDDADKQNEPEGTQGQIVSGLVRNSDGKPAASAFLAVVAFNVQPKPGATDLSAWPEVLAEGTTTADGKFKLQLGKVTSKTHISPSLLARTKNSGVVWERLDLDAAEADVTLKLKPQQLLQGRLVDIEGQPVAGVPIKLSSIVEAAKDGRPVQGGIGFSKLKQPPKAWLPKISTDERGNFTVRNLAEGHGVFLKIAGTEQVATQDVALNTGISEQRGKQDGTYRPVVKNFKPGEVATIALAPAQIFEGVVLLGDTGKPAANARITMWASQQDPVGSMVSIEGKTDAEGRFRLNPYAGVRFGIIAYPPKGSPYQVKRLNDLRWDSGDGPKKIEIRLDQGVLARGTVVDAKTGKPLKGASVQYHPNRFNKNLTSDIVTGWQSIQKTNDNGEFEITVLPGRGTLLVHASNGSNYVLQAMSSRELSEGKPGGARNYAHAFRKIDPQAGEPFEAMKIELQPGATVTGTLVDQEGKPIDRAVVVSRLKIVDHSPQWRGFPDEANGGKFEIRGLRDGEEYPVYFLDGQNKLGAAATISTSSKSPKIVLKPCGSAKARFVDLEGKPVASGLQLGLHMVVTLGKPKYDFNAYRNGEALADEDFVGNIDQVNYRPAPKTNASGGVTFPALIPGARYRFISFIDGKADVSKEFIAKSGETYDMGDIKVQINE